MKVKPVKKTDSEYFCKITLNFEEAKILSNIVNCNINELTSYGVSLDLPEDANETFAHPLFEQLEKLGL